MNDEMKNAAELGQLVLRHRRRAALSIDDLAEATGIDRSTINRIERGLIAAPSPQKLQRLAEALGTDVEDYFALAGYFTTHGLPDLGPYLRAKYDVTPEVAREVQDYFDFVRHRNENNNNQAAA